MIQLLKRLFGRKRTAKQEIAALDDITSRLIEQTNQRLSR